MKRTLLFLLSVVIAVLPVVAQQKKIAVLPTVCKDGSVSYATCQQVCNGLEVGIVTNRDYESYSRTAIDDIMKEQDFQRSGVVSEDEIRQFRFAGVDYILSSEVSKTDDGNLFVSCKILNIETARIELTNNCVMCLRSEIIARGCKSMGIYITKGKSGSLPSVSCDGTTSADSHGGNGDGKGDDKPPLRSGPTVAPEDLVAYYTFEGNANDLSENRQHGNTMSNPAFVSGVQGKALHILDSKNQKLNIPHGLLKSTRSWTICFWIKDFGTGVIFTEMTGNTCSKGLYSSPKGQFALIASYNQYDFDYSIRRLQTSGWHHIAIVSDQEQHSTSLYVDGSKMDEVNGTLTSDDGSKFIFGGKTDRLPATSFKIDNLRFYKHALSSTDISNIYRSRQ